MKPNTAEDSVFLPEGSVKTIADEVANGEYGLVINGHSLVRLGKFTGLSHWLFLFRPIKKKMHPKDSQAIILGKILQREDANIQICCVTLT